ncbi:helicase-exonuclease AddAB subunit AddA [Clostridium hydrogeniformans]|uniref:helicase-exonuclease AddAB subunit AddA n=1 Tax=Clostridium hydrogeniformans TaxID=349933 RepID=UPI000489F126|nr:helicase-exonuclease AddAB subunit AddA [Clostridium hydrogeniformans]
MKTKWTSEQESAIVTRNCNLLVAAAAGSGKTAVLVERIIRMITDLNNPVDIDKLLVVTFTKAAASEMRERIGDAISKKLDENPSSKVLQRQLTLLNKSNITTMHSFCLDVIKNNFHHIDLDPSFRIADQTEIILMKQEIIEELFEDMYNLEDKNHEFFNLIDAFSGNRDDKNIQSLVESIYSFSMSGPSPKIWLRNKAEDFNLKDDFNMADSKWVKILMKGIEDEVKSFIKDIENIRDICEDEGLLKAKENIEETLGALYVLMESIDKSYDDIYISLGNIPFSRLTLKGVEEDTKEVITSTRKDIKKRIEKLYNSINFPMEESVEAIKEMYPIMKALVNLIIEFMDRFEENKRKKGLLDFNDLEHLCLKILNEGYETGEVIPSQVALGIREKFDEVLVDEYQDSNNVQETIIDLVSRKLSDKPNVFMVGDVKQSIYRFRQAKPELFLNKYNTYSEEEGEKDRKILLYKNFRSREEVVDGVNYVFKKIMSEMVGELEYTDKEALNLGANYKECNEENSEVGGALEFHVVDLKEDDGEEIIIEETKYEENEEEDLDKIQIEAKLVASRIKDIMREDKENKFMVYDKGIDGYREVKFKDIVILLRATKNWAEVFTEELAKSDIPSYADASSGYFDAIEIKTIMSLLQIIDNPLQDIPMLSVLRSPIFSFTSEELIDIRVFNRDKYFYESLKDIASGNLEKNNFESGYVVEPELKEKASRVIESLSKWRDKAIHMPIDEFIWYLYMDTAYYGYVRAMPNGVQRQANLRILFQRAKQYEKTSFKGLFNFINFINKLKKNSGDMGSAKTLGENENVVRIMSIHKSKGLEFPVVFLSGCGKQFNDLDLKGQILYHEELGFGPDYVNYDDKFKFPTIAKEAIKKKIKMENLSEEMRVLYVAFTRAREKLIITGTSKDLRKDCEKWGKAIRNRVNDKIPSTEIFNSKRYLDWIGMALMIHRDGEILRDYSQVEVNSSESEKLSTWKVYNYNKYDLIVDKVLEVVDENLTEEEFFETRLEKVAYGNEINRRLDWKYYYIEASKLPANISVSELKRSSLLEENQGEIYNLYEEKKENIIRKPLFLQENKGLSAAERGTAVHGVMQHLDLNRVESVEDIKKQLTLMMARELLTEEEVKAINPYKILSFFNSDIGRKLLEIHKKDKDLIHRETPFYIEIPSTIINNSLEKDKYKDEKVRLQGVIDCFIEENDHIILVDYKTDYVENTSEAISSIKDRYMSQLDYYTEALERITGKKVEKRYIYLFYIEKVIEL